ncbi:MAG: hypothetical protein EOO06_03990 [Chitinophagaceae bacterium]|nr:MAG: hypothetical protein EOO06_03990 [Chitinophagaceae bacterium]
MSKKNLFKSALSCAIAAVVLSSCAKEDVLQPAPPKTGDGTQNIIYIRAVDKDSSAVESAQLLLR